MLNKIKDYFKKNRDKDSTDKPPKKRSFLDVFSKTVGILIGAIIIYNFLTMYRFEDKIVTGKHLGIVRVSGTISSDSNASANLIAESVNKAMKNKNTVAVALVIDSGGGSPYESEKLVRELNVMKKIYAPKKIYAVVEGIGASAAYHIASAADEIIVGETSLIGSIGVILSNYDARKLQDKIGIYDRTITAGENKDILSYTKDITPLQREHINTTINLVHQKFIHDVKEGRKGKISQANEVYSGLFWVGSQAINLGVADRIGDTNTLMRELSVNKYKNYTKQNNGLNALFGATMRQVGQGIAQGISDGIQEATVISIQ